MFRIGEFSRICRLSADALYHYENKGILVPAMTDAFTGYRYYDASQLVTVNKILALKDAGFSLDEICGLLNSDIPAGTLIGMLEDKARFLENAVKEQHDRLDRLRTNIFLIKNGGIPCMNEVTIKKVEPILIASIRKAFQKDCFDENLEKMWHDVNEYIKEKGAKRIVPCLMLYHAGHEDMRRLGLGYDEHTLDVEVAEPVAAAFEGNGEVNVYSLTAADKMACIVHNGPFGAIGGTFSALYEWMTLNRYNAAGPLREIYHKGGWVTDNEEEYVTELQVPLC